MTDKTPESRVSAPTSIKAFSSIVLDAYAKGAEATLDPTKVEAQMQEALGAEVLAGDGRWPGHATILLALGNPAIAETRMESEAWEGACQVMAEYLISRFLPRAKDVDARYTHQTLGTFTLPDLALLPAFVADRLAELQSGLDVHAPQWQQSIDRLWQSGPARVFHTALSHIVAEGLRDHFVAWVGHSLAMAKRLSEKEVLDHIPIIARIDHEATSDTLLNFLAKAKVRLMTPLPEELHEEYGKTINELLDKLEEAGAVDEVKKVRATLLAANLVPNNTLARPEITSL